MLKFVVINIYWYVLQFLLIVVLCFCFIVITGFLNYSTGFVAEIVLPFTLSFLRLLLMECLSKIIKKQLLNWLLRICFALFCLVCFGKVTRYYADMPPDSFSGATLLSTSSSSFQRFPVKTAKGQKETFSVTQEFRCSSAWRRRSSAFRRLADRKTIQQKPMMLATSTRSCKW